MAASERPGKSPPEEDKVRVLRIIARLNVGGPAIHTVLLTSGLNDSVFHTTLVTGRTGAQEGDMSYYAGEHGVQPSIIPELGREISWRDDLTAFVKLVAMMRRIRPHIVHTHTTKAGVLGRLAAWVSGVPIRVHTYHGHGFEGYRGAIKTRIFIWIERFLCAITSRAVAISERQRDDLCDVYRLIPRKRCEVIPLGFDLGHFETAARCRGEIRRLLSCPESRQLVGIVGRLVPIKNHVMFLDMARQVRAAGADVDFVIVGDGELRQKLEQSVVDLGLAGHVHFLGWRRDLDAVYADLDVVVLTSLNEGTPVALIEAMASARPVVSTDVGGIADVVAHEQAGLLVASGDAGACAQAVRRLLDDPALRERMGAEGRRRALARYGSRRLVAEVRALYERLLSTRGMGGIPGGPAPAP